MIACAFLLSSLLFTSPPARAAVTSVTPVTWNIIGLDSNTPAAGPNRFPVGARICSSTGETKLPVTFSWDTFDNPYINLSSRAPLADDVIYIDVPSTGTRCADAYFEVVVTQDSAAFDTTREYHITAGGLSTPIPRELYIEHLISQGRNYIQDLQFGTSVASLTSVPAGGGFSLTKGGTYFIRLVCSTATQGYEQLESFTSLPNTVFQILSVATTYSADSTTNVNPPYDKLYGDACSWENDPDSPNYLACNGEGKIGGSITVTYEVKIIDVRAGAQNINSLIHDFSGSSFHYNSDYLSGGRSLYLIDPANIDIAKAFAPSTIASGGTSILTLTLSNPNNAVIDKVKFSDVFPAPMVVTASPTISNGCGGTLYRDSTKTATLAAGDNQLYLEGGAIPANGSCTIKVSVTTSAATTTTYKNTTGHLYVDALDTLKFAEADLTVDDSAIPDPIPPLTCSVGTRADLARWTLPAGKTTPDPTYDYIDNTDHTPADVDFAYARFNAGGGTGVQAIDTTTWTTANAWMVTNWPATNTGYPSVPATGSATWPANHPYFEFEVDSSLYGNVGITFDANLAGNWAVASNNYLYVYSSADGINFTNILVYTPLTKNTAYLNIAATAAATGRARTYFRINIVGAQGNGTPQSLSLDNIRVSGCPVPNDILPPTIIKAYDYDPVAVNEATTLTFTVTNPNSTHTLSEVEFSDSLPGGMKVATPPNASTSAGCGTPIFAPAANATTLTFSNGSLATSGVCTVTVSVVATASGIYENTSGLVTAKETGANSTASGFASKSLTALAPPTIVKQFLPNAILTGETSTLTFTLVNPNPGYALSGVRFTDPLPSGVKVADPPNVTTSGCGSPTFAPVKDETTLTFDWGTIAAGGTCKASVDITADTAGNPHTNTTTAVYHTLNSADWIGATATDKLYVTAPTPRISLLKQISTSNSGPWSSYVAVNPGANVYYRLTLENIGDVTLSPVIVDDPQVSTAGCVWPATLKAVDDPTNDGNDEIASCILTKSSVIPGDVTNTATASGTFGLTTVQDSASARYATIGLVFTKTPQETKFTLLGETLHYNFVVANTGYAPMAGMTLDDPKTPDEVCTGGIAAAVITGSSPVTLGDGDSYLDRGEELHCTATYQIVQSDIDDKVAINTATAEIGGQTRTASATVTYGDGLPLLTILKSASANGGPASKINPGEVITYTVEIENTGGGGASAVTLKDHLSPYVAFGLDSYGAAVGFTVTDSTPPSGLFLGTPQYSADKGANWDHPPTSGGGDAPAGYDGAITNWKIPLSGAMRIGGKFILNYQTIVK